MTDQEAIRDLQRRWFHATQNGDVTGLADLMTDDVVFFTSGRAPFGREAFLDSFRAMQESVVLSCNGEYLEVIVAGDLAYATARLDITVTPKSGGPIKQLAGNALSVFRRMPDGSWRLARDANLVAPKPA